MDIAAIISYLGRISGDRFPTAVSRFLQFGVTFNSVLLNSFAYIPSLRQDIDVNLNWMCLLLMFTYQQIKLPTFHERAPAEVVFPTTSSEPPLVISWGNGPMKKKEPSRGQGW